MEFRPGKGVPKKERSFQTPGNLLTAESVPSLGSTEGNITGGKINKELKPAHCEPCGNSPSREAAQTPAQAGARHGGMARAASLKDLA